MADGRPFEVSLALPRYLERGTRDPYRITYDLARRAEDLGYFAGYVGHHSFTPETGDPAAPFVLLGAIAARTERLRLGTAIYLSALHHPVTVGEQVAQLDQVSGGRAILGVGVGYRPYEYEGFGVDFRRRGKLLTESIEILRHAWTTGSFGWEGECFTIPDLVVEPPCVQEPHPPILAGGTSEGSIRRAAQVADGWLSLPMETLGYVAELADLYRAECKAAGRTPRICLLREAWVGPTVEAVQEQWLDKALAFHKYYWEAGTRGDDHDPVLQRVAAGEAVAFEEFVRDRAIAGTPEMCIAELGRWHDAIGFDEVCLLFGGRRDPALVADVHALFAEEVASAFTST